MSCPGKIRAGDSQCDYCGSLCPDLFMLRLERGDVKLTPTDKNYKVYVENLGGELFRDSYRECPEDSPPHMPDVCSHWVTRNTENVKFYFEHLSEEQRHRFIELFNAGNIRLAYPGHFYVLPFFARSNVGAQ